MRLFVLALLLPAAALAQAPAIGTLAGVVMDDTGMTLPGAIVFLPELQRGAATNIDGTYRIEDLPVGTYVVEVSSVGIHSETLEEVQIPSGNVRRLATSLAVPKVSYFERYHRYERPLIS